jgi:hypothetical protein
VAIMMDMLMVDMDMVLAMVMSSVMVLPACVL